MGGVALSPKRAVGRGSQGRSQKVSSGLPACSPDDQLASPVALVPLAPSAYSSGIASPTYQMPQMLCSLNKCGCLHPVWDWSGNSAENKTGNLARSQGDRKGERK